MTQEMVENQKQLIKFLSSKHFPKIGKKTATILIEELGANIIDLVNRTEPDSIPFITANLSKKLIKHLYTIKTFCETNNHDYIADLCRAGATPNQAKKIRAELGKDIQTILSDPEQCYDRLTEIDGVGFILTDKIALGLGLNCFYTRVKHGIEHLILEFNMRGHHGVKKHDLIKVLSDYFHSSRKPISTQEIIQILRMLKSEKLIFDSEFDPYFVKVADDYFIEKQLAQKIKQKMENITYFDLEYQLKDYINNLSLEQDITLTEQQRNALATVFYSDISVICGGAGTGKSLVTSKLVQFLRGNGKSCLCLSPTGKASQRLNELLRQANCEQTALTIHRWLYSYDPNNYDVVIIDEFSMVTSKLFLDVLKDLSLKTKLVLIGDPHQLPSIGA